MQFPYRLIHRLKNSIKWHRLPNDQTGRFVVICRVGCGGRPSVYNVCSTESSIDQIDGHELLQRTLSLGRPKYQWLLHENQHVFHFTAAIMPCSLAGVCTIRERPCFIYIVQRDTQCDFTE